MNTPTKKEEPPQPQSSPRRSVIISPIKVIQNLRQRRKRRSLSAPPKLRKPMTIADHFRVVNNEGGRKLVVPGMPKYEDDWARDSHDFFNLIVLLPIIVLNLMNWNWEILLNLSKKQHLEDAWTDEWFDLFYWSTLSYFIADLMWIIIIPNSVKSPGVILKHHIFSMIYLLIPYYRPQRRWCMGACMSVELNTWFLIARRVFNKQGFPPWTVNLSFVSFRLKFISICFYVTWFTLRVILYPFLMVQFTNIWLETATKNGGTYINIDLPPPIFHFIFVVLNLKWTVDLISSKLRYLRRRRKGGSKAVEYEKGL